jgi:hypothetical protein
VKPFDPNYCREAAGLLLTRAGIAEAPVDLCAIAKSQRVVAIHFIAMIREAGIRLAPGGFEIFIRDEGFRTIDLSAKREGVALNRRQRFSLAHEIAHTLLFDLAPEVPKERDTVETSDRERFCQDAAKLILIPPDLLRKEADLSQPITAKLVITLAAKFECSAEVVIRRIHMDVRDAGVGSCLALARLSETGNDAQVVAACWDTGVLKAIRNPRNYEDNLSRWLGEYIDEGFWKSQAWGKQAEKDGATITLEKVPYRPDPPLFFVQILVSDKAGPAPVCRMH